MPKIDDLENQLRSKDTTDSELRQANRRLEARCQDYESSITHIQPKYQEALNDRGRFEHEITKTIAAQNKLTMERDTKDAELAHLRAEKAIVDAELAEARATLSSSSIPEIAEQSRLKEELAKANAEKQRLQKRISSMQNDYDYIRDIYQKSSSKAAEAANELREVRAEMELLREKADANIVRVHEIQRDNEIATYLQRLKQKTATIVELEREVDRKVEELKAVMNGRRATRGTSVPRSPRMGGASKFI